MSTYETVTREVVHRSAGRSPLLVGIGGAVAVGKTSVATTLARELSTLGLQAQVLSTDAFLMSNAALAERDLTMRKGFPESYDTAEIARVLGALKDGRAVDVRVYSHGTYDIVDGSTDHVSPAGVVAVEGVVALQPPVVGYIDLAVYVDASEDDIRGWFVRRFLSLVEDARADESSFYRAFADIDGDQVRAIAEATWDSINAVNLHEHIAPSMANADFVIEKSGDHSVTRITTQDRA